MSVYVYVDTAHLARAPPHLACGPSTAGRSRTRVRATAGEKPGKNGFLTTFLLSVLYPTDVILNVSHKFELTKWGFLVISFYCYSLAFGDLLWVLFRAAFKSVSTAVHLKNTSFTLSALNCVNWMTKNKTVCIVVNCECQCANNAVRSRFCCMTAKVIWGGNSFVDTFCLFVAVNQIIVPRFGHGTTAVLSVAPTGCCSEGGSSWTRTQTQWKFIYV